MKKQPTSIRIFLADGTPEGLKIVDVSNWTGKALVVSRAQFQKVKDRPEFNRPGIYVLMGKDAGDHFSSIYIGEGDPVLPRLDSHVRNKDFWTHLIVMVSKDPNLNKAHIQYLESRLVQIAIDLKRVEIENGNAPALPSLSEPDEAEMEIFLDNMLSVFGVIGLSAFEKPTIEQTPQGKQNDLFLQASNGTSARGRDTPEGFLVYKGSRATLQTVPSWPDKVKQQRELLVQKGVFESAQDSLILNQDYLFSSPSLASCLFLGRSSNGRVDWKTEGGKTLKAIQEEIE